MFVEEASDLDADASLAPVSSLGIVSVRCILAITSKRFVHSECSSQFILLIVLPDGVARSQPDPLWNWSVLLLRFRELLLRSESLVGLQ